MTSPSREAFEAHIHAKYKNQRVATLMLERMDGERYISKSIDYLWAGWQAAIQHARDVAARVCNGEMVEEIQPVDHCYNNACVRCADAIKEALK